jgi:hypothetical protein
MPYGNDDWLREIDHMQAESLRRFIQQEKADLILRLKEKFGVPQEFMDLAVRIWHDGKED